jgi:dienelactone hydrolase
VVYRTVGAAGDPTTASQLVALPTNDQSDLRVVLWLHGTTVYRGDVASMKAESTDRAVALLLASAGGAVSAPDCIGLGEGPGTHPYGHPGATLSASLDALRAARDVARQQGRTIDERVQVSGFSPGGPAATMVGRAVQEGGDPDFSPGGLTPIGGPFDLSGFEAAAANDDNL